MREAQKLQDGRTTQPRKSRPSVRHDQPPRVRAQGWNMNKKRPERPAHPMRSAPRDGRAAQGHEARRSGQLVRVTGRPHTGEEWKACRDEAALVGGDRKHASRQACSRSHYQTGRARLPGGSGLEGTDQPSRRRANARYVQRRASFGSLRKRWGDTARQAIRVIKLIGAAVRESYHHEPVAVRDTGLLPFVDGVTR